jgi:hypothetical protein
VQGRETGEVGVQGGRHKWGDAVMEEMQSETHAVQYIPSTGPATTSGEGVGP